MFSFWKIKFWVTRTIQLPSIYKIISQVEFVDKTASEISAQHPTILKQSIVAEEIYCFRHCFLCIGNNMISGAIWC